MPREYAPDRPIGTCCLSEADFYAGSWAPSSPVTSELPVNQEECCCPTDRPIGGAGPVPGEGYNSFYGPWIKEIDLGLTRAFRITERHSIEIQAQVFNLFNHPNYFVQAGSGIVQNQYVPTGGNCGDGATLNQTCDLLPASGFKTRQSINQLNGPRTFQFAFRYRF